MHIAELVKEKPGIKPMPSTQSPNQRLDFAAVYDENIKFVYDFIYYKIQHRETAEDLTSQTFFKAFNSYEKFDANKASVKTWLARIARNTLIDHFRAKKIDVNLEQAWDIPDGINMENNLDHKSALRLVHDHLKNLSDQQREIVTMRLWQDMSYREIAAIIGISEPAVKMTMSRIVRKLREQIPAHLLVMLLIFMQIYGQ